MAGVRLPFTEGKLSLGEELGCFGVSGLPRQSSVPPLPNLSTILRANPQGWGGGRAGQAKRKSLSETKGRCSPTMVTVQVRCPALGFRSSLEPTCSLQTMGSLCSREGHNRHLVFWGLPLPAPLWGQEMALAASALLWSKGRGAGRAYTRQWWERENAEPTHMVGFGWSLFPGPDSLP